MSLDNLLNTIEKYVPYDIILILSDGTNTVTMNAHKMILLSQCIYFEKLLTNFVACNLKNISICVNCETEKICNITINVPNAYICYDVFQSFYKHVTNIHEYPHWYHLLESFKCRDFFGLDIDQSLLLNLDVPPEGFEKLIDVIDLLGYTNNNIKIINKNLPKEYDLSKFPKELISKMIENAMDDIIIIGTNNYATIRVWDVQKNELIKTWQCDSMYRISCLCVSSGGKQIIAGHSDGKIIIRDSHTGTIINNLRNRPYFDPVDPYTRECIVNIFFLPDNDKIISGHERGTINIWNIKTNELINTFIDNDLLHDKIIYFVLSPDHNIIVYGTTDGKYKIFNIQTFTLIYTENCATFVSMHRYFKVCACFSPDNKKIVFGNSNGTIETWSIDFTIGGIISPPELVNTLSGHYTCVKDICFSTDGTKIISGSDDRTIQVWDVITGNLIIKISNTKQVKNICISSDDRNIISISEKDTKIRIWNIATGHLVNVLDDDYVGKPSAIKLIQKNNKFTLSLKKFL